MLRVNSPFDDCMPRSANLFNYINTTNPDTSGMLRFVTDELQDAEDAGDRGSSSFNLYKCFSKMFIFLSLDPWARPFRLGWY